jgi:transient receptor potential cation channel subfamily M member 3
MAHPCAQIILSDLWMGGLRTRRWTNVKVIIGLLFPPMILQLDFKSIEELQLMPQTMEEHLLELKEEHARNSDDTSASGSLAGHVNAVCIEDDVNPKDGRVVKSPDSREPPDVYNVRKKQRQLNFKKKIYEFYAAPIVKFWCHSMAYIAFLLIYTYTLLIKLPEVPAWNEYYVMAYIATFGCEMIHEIVVSEPIQLRQKLWVWLHNWLNACDAAFVLEFVLGLALRFADGLTEYGRVFYCLNILYW